MHGNAKLKCNTMRLGGERLKRDACPLTAAGAISVAAKLDGSIIQKTLGAGADDTPTVRIGHPSGVMTMVPTVVKDGPDMNKAQVPGVAVQRTARRIMDGTLYIRH